MSQVVYVRRAVFRIVRVRATRVVYVRRVAFRIVRVRASAGSVPIVRVRKPVIPSGSPDRHPCASARCVRVREWRANTKPRTDRCRF